MHKGLPNYDLESGDLEYDGTQESNAADYETIEHRTMPVLNNN